MGGQERKAGTCGCRAREVARFSGGYGCGKGWKQGGRVTAASRRMCGYGLKPPSPAKKTREGLKQNRIFQSCVSLCPASAPPIHPHHDCKKPEVQDSPPDLPTERVPTAQPPRPSPPTQTHIIGRRGFYPGRWGGGDGSGAGQRKRGGGRKTSRGTAIVAGGRADREQMQNRPVARS